MESIEELIRAIARDEAKRYLEEHSASLAGVVVVPREGPAGPGVGAARLYSVAAVAELLEVATDYVYDRIKAGELAVVELGHGRAKQRIAALELQRFIESRTYGRH